MSRLLVFLVCGFLGLGVTAGSAAPAPAITMVTVAPVDLFSVLNVRVDASAESAGSARDAANSQGRLAAWTKLFRRFVPSSGWAQQPQLEDGALLRLVRAFDVANERRSTTRYLADITYHFNANAVRALLRQSGAAFTETRSRAALIIPVISGKSGVDANGPWAAAWKDPSLRQGLVPFVLPEADDADADLLTRPDMAALDWAALAPMVRRHNADHVILAIASEDAKTVQMIAISATARTAASFAFANSNFLADAEAIAERADEAWKVRSALSYGTRGKLTADVRFESLEDWAKIRALLGAARVVSDMDVIGLALHEAEISLSFFGRPEQLRDVLAAQDLELSNTQGQYSLQLMSRPAGNAP